jgi:hypothetical protein
MRLLILLTLWSADLLEKLNQPNRSDGIPRLNITQFVPHQLSCFGYDRRDQGIILLSPGENEKSVAKAQKRPNGNFFRRLMGYYTKPNVQAAISAWQLLCNVGSQKGKRQH